MNVEFDINMKCNTDSQSEFQAEPLQQTIDLQRHGDQCSP